MLHQGQPAPDPSDRGPGPELLFAILQFWKNFVAKLGLSLLPVRIVAKTVRSML
jgi:hypothetical protein